MKNNNKQVTGKSTETTKNNSNMKTTQSSQRVYDLPSSSSDEDEDYGIVWLPVSDDQEDLVDLEEGNNPEEEDEEEEAEEAFEDQASDFSKIVDAENEDPSVGCKDYDVMNSQPVINIGTLGHVAHGKSTIVRGLTGVRTTKHTSEMKLNITIKLGYANCKIYKCSAACAPPECYKATGGARLKPGERVSCNVCSSPCRLVTHVSFVDCPGHEILMATMLNGAAVMDGALLVVAANEKCPQPQTQEHLAAAEAMDLNNVIVVQNKVDLKRREEVLLHSQQMQKFLQNSYLAVEKKSVKEEEKDEEEEEEEEEEDGEGKSKLAAPFILPVCAQRNMNLDALCQHIVERIPIPDRDRDAHPHMVIVRSFDVNKPGTDIENIKGGVAGGSLIRGSLAIGDIIEIRPGIMERKETKEIIPPPVQKKSSTGKPKQQPKPQVKTVVTFECTPILARVTSLASENNSLERAIPGGLIGVGTNMDPSLTRADRLVGQVLGKPGHLPPVYLSIFVQYKLMKRVIGDAALQAAAIEKLRPGETLKLNVASSSISAQVVSIKPRENVVEFRMGKPACIEVGKDKIAMSRQIGPNGQQRWRLIGWGVVLPSSVPLKLNKRVISTPED
eukprot:TRINITY_DN234_c0_g6_i1.p1 TRINITY_DN234_c0_g6~~TRINITY_DN234_c0_g6_i1.p1  ORF type:complete len:615 (+),score=179.88 TRINITY_DN234_c0_g6_i1:499-2343(+)